jgi:nitrous oxide reductase accessory protein NosL
MKKICMMLLLAVACLCTIAVAVELPDIQQHAACAYCGMDRQKFSHSRMVIDYDDGSSAGLCSLHCAALDLANQLDKMPLAILVADYNTKQLMNAEEATWALGGNKKGVMTMRAKWAFLKQADANEFITANSGEIVAFEGAVKAAYEDMYRDTKMIRTKRKEMKMMKK